MEEFVTRMESEIREDFQIPPYFSKESLSRMIQEGIVYLGALKDNVSENDEMFIGLLKNYTYYAFHHKVHEFAVNYNGMILTWQLEGAHV